MSSKNQLIFHLQNLEGVWCLQAYWDVFWQERWHLLLCSAWTTWCSPKRFSWLKMHLHFSWAESRQKSKATPLITCKRVRQCTSFSCCWIAYWFILIHQCINTSNMQNILAPKSPCDDYETLKVIFRVEGVEPRMTTGRVMITKGSAENPLKWNSVLCWSYCESLGRTNYWAIQMQIAQSWGSDVFSKRIRFVSSLLMRPHIEEVFLL